ncbi:hypothetical protein N7528_006505 [Penicillium herquei]|nr:hypothetical protein N7528_006505 [Penicillium herquei]
MNGLVKKDFLYVSFRSFKKTREIVDPNNGSNLLSAWFSSTYSMENDLSYLDRLSPKPAAPKVLSRAELRTPFRSHLSYIMLP